MGPVSYPQWCNAVIEKGIVFLLLFTPLAFGTVHDWSIAVMEVVAFIILGAWLLKITIAGRIEVVKTPLVGLTAAFIGLVLFQLVPLPPSIVKAISPSTALLYDRVFGAEAWDWRTISVHSGATLEELFKLLAYAAVFFVMINHYKSKEQVQTIVKTIVYMACFLLLLALAQKATWNGKLFWLYEIDIVLQSRAAQIWGPYINRNHFAGYMEMAMPLSAGMLLYRSSSMGRSHHKQRLHRRIASFVGTSQFPKMAAWSLAVLILAGAVFMTLSRGGIIAMSASMVLLIALARTRRSLKKKVILLVMVGLVIFFSVVIASWDKIAGRFEDLADTAKVQRLDVWTDAAGIIREFPAMGTGFGTFKSIYQGYQTKYPVLQFEHAENDYIELVTDCGLAGLIVIGCMVAVYMTTLVKAWQRRHDLFVKCIVTGGIGSSVAIAIHSFTDFNTRIPGNAMLLTVILAMTYATVLNVNKSSTSSGLVADAQGQKEQMSLPGSQGTHA